MRAKEFWTDNDGAVMPYLAMMLAVIIGLSALALDGSRLMSLQTQLQNGADALALAGAAELDRRPDSIIRAEAAVDNLIRNPVVGAGVDQTVRASHIDFLQTLPERDDLPVTTANLTNDPTLAAYIQVTVAPANLQTIFPLSLISRRINVNLSAHAVAGYDQVVCNVQPLLVCNPFETTRMTDYEATQALVSASQDPASQHRLIRLRGTEADRSSPGIYGPGTISYAAPATGFFPAAACGPGSAYGIPQALAASRVQACFRLSAVNLLPGNDAAAMDGLNTRFDIYANGFASCRVYEPDLNVRKGFTAFGNVNWCNAEPAGSNWPMPDPNNTALPVDSNMIQSNGTLDRNIAVGNGIWNCARYWSDAHYAGPGKSAAPPGCDNAATISRYQVYNYEMSFLNDRSLGGEIGGPACAPPGRSNRRVMTAAIVNCGSSPIPVRGEAQGVPVAAFGRFFLVLPANARTAVTPYAEFLGLIERTDPLSRDLVELNR